VSVTGGLINDVLPVRLVKKDGGLPRIRATRTVDPRELDQLLEPVQDQLNLNAIHSLTNRGISNNDNTGTSTYLVYPTTRA